MNEEAMVAHTKYFINDMMELSLNGARDGGFDIINAYLIWLIIAIDGSLNIYLRHDNIKFRPVQVNKIKSSLIGGKIRFNIQLIVDSLQVIFYLFMDITKTI